METSDYSIGDSGEIANRSTKKVRIRDGEDESDEEMVLAQTLSRPRSWKDRLLGIGLQGADTKEGKRIYNDDEDLELPEADIVRSTINGLPSIRFSEQINQLLIKDMARTVVIKLLGRNISYSVLYNKVCSLWKPSQGFRLVDVENGYFLAKLQSKEDVDKVLREGPWIVFVSTCRFNHGPLTST